MSKFAANSKPERLALPARALPAPCDARAWAAEMAHRLEEYIALIRQQDLGLPASSFAPGEIHIVQLAQEAGVDIWSVRAGGPLRAGLNSAASELGLAEIIRKNDDHCDLSIADYKTRFLMIAPAMAQKNGIKCAAQQAYVSAFFDCLIARAGGDQAVAARPIVTQMQLDAKQDLLDLPHHTLSIVKNFEDWQVLSDNPARFGAEEMLAQMEFVDLMINGLERTGVSVAQAAAICGCKRAAFRKWIRGVRIPNARSHLGLRVLSQQFGYPETTLENAITRLQDARGISLNLQDFPERYRARRSIQLRNSVKMHLSAEDLHLPHKTLRARIATLCAQLDEEGAQARRRKKMRDENRIDRASFPPELQEELARFCRSLESKRRSPATQKTYQLYLEGFFGFALSSHVPPHLALPPDRISLSCVASRPLWDAYFEHMTAVGQRHFGAEFRICRATAERLNIISAMFHLQNGFMRKNRDILAKVAELGAEHLQGIAVQDELHMLRAIQADIVECRSEWIAKSKPPVSGRNEIADLLSQPRPLLAVAQMIDFLHRRKASLRTWQRDGDGAHKQLNHRYATVLRRLVMMHLLGQTALRIGMLPALTVGVDPAAHLKWQEGARPHLCIPADLFKNEDSEVFRDGDYARELRDTHGCYADLKDYLNLARPFFLDGQEDDRLFLSRGPRGGYSAAQRNILANEIRQISQEAIGRDAPPGQRLIKRPYLRPHHFRDILATDVLHRTNRNYALAADAIHVTEKTARAYYAHDSATMRRPMLDAVFDEIEAEARLEGEEDRDPDTGSEPAPL